MNGQSAFVSAVLWGRTITELATVSRSQNGCQAFRRQQCWMARGGSRRTMRPGEQAGGSAARNGPPKNRFPRKDTDETLSSASRPAKQNPSRDEGPPKPLKPTRGLSNSSSVAETNVDALVSAFAVYEINASDTAESTCDFSAFITESKVRSVLEANGILTPTLVQRQAIPLLQSGRTGIVKAPTGSGKTWVSTNANPGIACWMADV